MAVQKVLFQLVVEDVGLTARIEQTRQAIRDLNKEIRQNPGPERFAQIAVELSKNRRELAELTKQQKELNRELNALKVPKDSLAGLRFEYSKLSQAVAQLSAEERKSKFGQNLIKNARNVKTEIDGIEQSIGRFTSNVGNYQSALNGLGRAFAAIGIGASLNEIIGINTKISDSIADVAKTAGITTQEAQRLADTLEFRDTRTSLVDQLQIAQIGGQLGIAQDQLEAFTESVDVLNVSLGDQFGGVEEITRTIAGLRNVLTDFRTDDVSGDVLKLGNALNFLEAQGVATAPTIAEFVSRISGSAIPLGISTDKIFGLSTALAELSINPERGATAISSLLIEIARAPDVFAKSLGFTKKETEDFTELVNTDLVGALTLVSQTIAEGGDGTKNFAQTLDELGIGRQGAIEALGKLGGNIELVNTRIAQSGEALQATDSVFAEFEKKNNNAAAAVAKLQNAVVNLIASEGAQDAIEAVAKAVTNLITVLGDALEIVSENSTEFAALGVALFAFTGKGQAVASTISGITTALQTQTVATSAQTVATTASAAATRLLAAAQAALPLLALVAGIYAVVKAIDIYNANLSAAEKATNAVADAQEEIAESSAKEITALNAAIQVLKDSAASEEERAKAIEFLNKKYPEYLSNIELEKAGVEELTRIQSELTNEIIKSAAARAKSNAQAEVAEKIINTELRIAEIRRSQTAGEFSFQDRAFLIRKEEETLKSLREELEEVGNQFDDVFGLRDGVDVTKNLFGVDTKQLDAAKAASGEIVNLSKLTIAELEKLGTDAAKAEITRRRAANTDLSKEQQKAGEKAKRDREKAVEDEAKAVEAQQKRIRDINKAIRDLQLGDENTFDDQVNALENERVNALEQNAERLSALRDRIKQETGQTTTGTTGAEIIRQVPNASPASITEADLIDRETAALGASFDDQRNELFRQREQTQAEQEAQLRGMLDEVNRIAAENEVAIAEGVGQSIEQSFAARREALDREFEQRDVALTESLSRGEINQRQFDEQELSSRIEQSNRIVQLEQERATRISEITTQIRDIKIAAAKAALDAELGSIERTRTTDVQAVEQDATLGANDAAARISAINEKAAEDAKAAQIDYANTVRETTADATATQLAGVDAVAAAQGAAHEAELQRIAEEQAARQQIRDAAIDTAGQIADGILQIQQNRVQQETNAELAALDEKYQKQIDAAQGNTALQAKLEKELAAKKEQIQKQAAEKSKKIAIVQAVIDTALSVLKALSSAPPPFNFVLAALAAAAGAVQIAVIKSQQFAAGGFTDEAQQPSATRQTSRRKKTAVYPKAFYDRLPDFSGIGGFTGAGGNTDSTGRPVAGKLSSSGAVVHAGEYVAPASQVAQFPALFEHLDAERLKIARPFAAGGLTGENSVNFVRVRPFQGGGFSDPVIGLPNAAQLQSQSISVEAQATFTDAQVQQIGQIIAAENAKVTRQALADGLGDANRRLEREQSLEQQRTI